jgi:hypothetical protein
MLVTIDEMDPHYYHVAFFAKRKINPFKELIWIIMKCTIMKRKASKG